MFLPNRFLRSWLVLGPAIAFLLLVSVSGQAQTPSPHLTGKVMDTTGAVMASVDVKVYKGRNSTPVKVSKTNGTGQFDVEIPAGEYRLEIEAPDFETAKRTVQVKAGMAPLQIELQLAAVVVEIEVATNEDKLSVDPDSSINGITVTPEEIAQLPDSNDDLAAYLKQLAGSVGGGFDLDSDSAEFIIDGLPQGELPPKDQIASIRIVEDLSAEGGRRIEIVTKAGSGPWRGNTSFSFNDSDLNANQPVTDEPKPSSRKRGYTTTFSGPVIQNKLGGSFSFRSTESEEGTQSIRTVTPFGNFDSTIVSPTVTREMSMSNLKWDIVPGKHSMTFSGSVRSEHRNNSGVGGFSLPERALNSEGRRWTFQVSQNSTVGMFVNLWRVQVSHNRNETTPVPFSDPIISGPIAVNVQDAFYGGSSQNRGFSRSTSFILSDQITTTLKRWTLQTNVQLNRNHPFRQSENNYRGTYTFSSLYDYCAATSFYGDNCAEAETIWDAAQTSNSTPTYEVPGPNGTTTQRTMTGIPTQFTQTQGDPVTEQHITTLQSQFNADWRKSQNMSLSFVVKHQIENYLHHLGNISPTVTVRYMILPKTRVSGEVNVTTSSFSADAYNEIRRSNGQIQQNIVILSPTYTAGEVPYNGSVSIAPQSTTIRTLSKDYEDPYNIQARIQLARQLPHNITTSASFYINRQYRRTRYRNINAPFPGTPLSDDLLSRLNAIPSTSCDTACTQGIRDAARAEVNGMRPDPSQGNILQYESTGGQRQKSLTFSLRVNNLNLYNLVRLTFGPNINIRWASDDPNQLVNSWSPSEWGRSQNDQRLQFRTPINISWFPAKRPRWQFTTNFTLEANSGRPYNITTGRDDNGDTVTNDRPDGVTRYSATAPGTYNLNVTFSKRFYLPHASAVRAYAEPSPEPQRGGGNGGNGGFRNDGFGGNGDRNRNGNNNNNNSNGKRYVTLQVQIQNLFNNTQYNPPSGVVTSRFFGQLRSARPGRQIGLNMQMNLF